MAFLETPRFPDRIAYGAVGGPMFRTEVAVSGSGLETSDGKWAYPRHAWDVSQGINSQADFAALRSFFMVAGGRHHGWRFKDWADFTVTHADGRVAGLTSTTFRLLKRYTTGSATQDRLIKKPIAAGFELKDSGTTLTLTTDYTLDAATGIVTTTSPRTAANLTWLGEFDVPMRFDTDKLDGRIEARNGGGLLHVWDAIPIIEVPV